MPQLERKEPAVSVEVLRELVRVGVRAVSADNSQPWRFRIHDGQLELFLAEQESPMFFDPASTATLMSCGAVLENIRLTAGLFGLRAAVQLKATWQQDRRIASIVLTPGSAPAEPLARHVHQRATHRGYYRRWHRVPHVVLQRMESALSTCPEHEVRWFTKGWQRRSARRLITRAERLRYTHEQVHREFHASLRFGAQAQLMRDGLAWDTLGVERTLLPLLRRLAPWSVTRTLNRVGLHYLMALRSAWLPLASAPVIGALVQAGDPDYIKAGQAFQRMWLAATEQGLALQPFGALPLFLLRMRELAGSGFDDRQKAALNSLGSGIWQLLGADPATHTLLMLFRLGYAGPPKAYARRWPVSHFLGDDGQVEADGSEPRRQRTPTPNLPMRDS
jgi:nitroreductase